jgi:NADH-quinone oxidoreductase subunit G
MAGLPTGLWHQLGLQAGDKVRIRQGSTSVVLPARREATLADGCVRVSAGHADTAGLGAMTGTLEVERVEAMVGASA